MPTLNDDLMYLHAIQDSLDDFLLSPEIFWPVSGEHTGHLPRLSLGGILLALQRAQAHPKTSAQQVAWQQANQIIQAARTRWRVNWERKAQREFESRLRQWANYLNEYRENPFGQAAYYPYEVRLRVMLDLLLEDCRAHLPEHLQEMYAGLNTLLQAVFVPGDFVWDAALQNGMPKARFWYLYGMPRKKR